MVALKRYFDSEKDYKKLLQKCYISPGNPNVGSGYSKDWLYGFVACLNWNIIIDDKEQNELNSFIDKLK